MTNSLLGRARASAVARSRTAVATVGGLTHPLRRAPGYLLDRSRSPAGPGAVVVEPDLSPRSLAARGLEPLFALGRRRYASCTGVVWTRPDRFVTGHLLACALVSYSFDDTGTSPRIRRRTTIRDPEALGQITNLAVSPDGAWLAVTDSTFGRCSIHPIDPVSGDPQPEAVARVALDGDHHMHAVEFSRDGHSVLFTAIEAKGGIRTAAFSAEPGSRTCTLGTPRRTTMDVAAPPKGLSFSPDGRLLAIGYGQNATRSATPLGVDALLEIRTHDPETGAIGEVVGRAPTAWNLQAIEDVTWFPDGERLAITDQPGDQVLICRVDPATGAVGSLDARIGWAAGGLRLPHGCATSPDGRWLAVTNYGDSSLRCYRLGA